MLSSRMTRLHPYVPGEQPKDRAYIKLNANENPYPPSPKVIKAAREAARAFPERLALYPDPDSNELRDAIARMLNKTGGVLCRAGLEKGKKNGSGAAVSPAEPDKIPFEVAPEMIFVGNGSDEVLSLVFYAFFDSDRRLTLPEHTYSFYPVYAGFYDIPLNKIPLNSDWTLNKERMLEEAVRENSGMIFANPNAPTSLALSRAEVRRMLEKAPEDKVFVVDEAYVDFGGESCIPLLAEFQNLVIVRTTSKSLCGAGLRLGYLVANKELVDAVTTVKNSFNHFPVDYLTQRAGIAACNDAGYYVKCAREVVRERDDFIVFLREKGWTVLESRTNFIFCKKNGLRGEDAYKRIREEGILVRHFAVPGIEDYLRITVGTRGQMGCLRAVMERI